MSIPSMASTAMPVHHMQYGYPHHTSLSANASTYHPNHAISDPRLTTAYHHYAPSHLASTQTPTQRVMTHALPDPSTPSKTSSQSTIVQSGREGKKPDWNEYYKNGIPQEVIVIDDDTPGPTTSTSQPTTTATRPSRTAPSNARPVAAGRKRKAHGGYEARKNDSPAFSTYPSKFDENSSSRPSVSTDRTTSLHTTAPTSLGSYGSSGGSHSYEDVNTGQKRKRAAPKETRAQAKRKQQEATSNAFADYVPPPKPPIKAGDVHVPVVAVVRSSPFLCHSRSRHHHRHHYHHPNMQSSMATNIRKWMTRTATTS